MWSLAKFDHLIRISYPIWIPDVLRREDHWNFSNFPGTINTSLTIVHIWYQLSLKHFSLPPSSRTKNENLYEYRIYANLTKRQWNRDSHQLASYWKFLVERYDERTAYFSMLVQKTFNVPSVIFISRTTEITNNFDLHINEGLQTT